MRLFIILRATSEKARVVETRRRRTKRVAFTRILLKGEKTFALLIPARRGHGIESLMGARRLNPNKEIKRFQGGPWAGMHLLSRDEVGLG
jgi:hypothetical protein